MRYTKEKKREKNRMMEFKKGSIGCGPHDVFHSPLFAAYFHFFYSPLVPSFFFSAEQAQGQGRRTRRN